MGMLATGLALVLGVVLGLVAGFFRGVLSHVIMRAMDVIMAFPALLLAIAITAALGPSLTNVMIAVGITGVPTFARLVHGEVLSVRERDYILAARTIGMKDLRIIARHVLPNVLYSIIVLSTLRLGGAILAETALSFLGMGIRPPTPSWGWMTNMGRAYLETTPWVTLFPGGAIFVTVLGFNFLGDGIRDLLDPRLKRGPKTA